jgi:hypothetical protein
LYEDTDRAPISTDRFVANLALGFDVPGPGIRIASDGPVRGNQVDMLTTLFNSSPQLPANRGIARGPIRSVMDLTDIERNAWLDYSIDLFGLDFPGSSLPPELPLHPGHRWTINWRPEDNREPSTVVIYRQWVRYKNAPLRAEQLWLSEDREHSNVRVLEPDATYSPTAIERAFRGLALMRGNSLLPAIERATKPGPDPDLPDDQLAAALLIAIKAEWRRLRDRPTLTHLALYFSNDPALPRQTAESLRKRISRANPPIDMKALYRQAKPGP